MLAYKKSHGTVVGMTDTMTITNEELLTTECDVLVPAAIGNQIRRDNAARVQARLVVEAANGPTTPAADDVLRERGIPVLPDILANAGGVAVSYFEWVQNIENQRWELGEVNAKLQAKVREAVDAVVDRYRELQSGTNTGVEEGGPRRTGHGPKLPPDLRTAALVVAIERVVSATLQRGIWP